MNTGKAKAALLKSRKIQSNLSDAQVRQVWRNLTDEERKDYMDKVKGDEDVTSIDSGKVSSGPKRSRGTGEPPDVPVPLS